jgi:hypothetical protein
MKFRYLLAFVVAAMTACVLAAPATGTASTTPVTADTRTC